MTKQPSTGFGRRMRLLTGAEFNAVFDSRRRLHGKNFNAYVAANSFGHPRVGITVSKRVSKKAVVRNRLKRHIRETFRRCQHELGAIDYVVIAKPGVDEKIRLQVCRELNKMWGNARRRCEK